MIPDGIWCSTNSPAPVSTVWPALAPPWYRTTRSARSASTSTILPLPSSPHWAPTTTTQWVLGPNMAPQQKNAPGSGRWSILRGKLDRRRAPVNAPREQRGRNSPGHLAHADQPVSLGIGEQHAPPRVRRPGVQRGEDGHPSRRVVDRPRRAIGHTVGGEQQDTGDAGGAKEKVGQARVDRPEQRAHRQG